MKYFFHNAWDRSVNKPNSQPRSTRIGAGSLALVMLASIYFDPATAQISRAEDRKQCSAYLDASFIVPRESLKDSDTAFRCLIPIIRGLKSTISVAEDKSAARDLLRASKAVRVIFDEGGEAVVRDFRKMADLDVISVLSFAARSDDYDLRLNSTLLLADVVDPGTLCVPLDHLYASPINPKGQANLLAIVNVGAAFATREDIDNIERAVGHLRKTLGPRLKEQKETMELVQIIERKIAVRKVEKSAPKNDGSDLRDCRTYGTEWAGDNIKY